MLYDNICFRLIYLKNKVLTPYFLLFNYFQSNKYLTKINPHFVLVNHLFVLLKYQLYIVNLV